LLQAPQGRIRDWIQRAARHCWVGQIKPAGLTGTAKNSFAPPASSSPWTTLLNGPPFGSSVFSPQTFPTVM
jgi:hypothetical protein